MEQRFMAQATKNLFLNIADIFEFDAMDDPPSVMNVHVYDFDGPFDEVTSLGHAEINFVKSNLSELADVWIPLQGNLAQSWQSKLHLRIFLSNSKGSTMVTEYLSKMEKEVGKKMTLRSPRTNTAFQELFSLPAEEFLISSFTCCLKRKLHTQVLLKLHIACMITELVISLSLIMNENLVPAIWDFGWTTFIIYKHLH
jgi:hypothetical protein